MTVCRAQEAVLSEPNLRFLESSDENAIFRKSQGPSRFLLESIMSEIGWDTLPFPALGNLGEGKRAGQSGSFE